MSHGVGILEAIEESRIVERNLRHQFARERATHLHGGRPVGVGEHRVLELELVQSPKNIRPS